MLQQPQQRDLSYEDFLEARGKLSGFKKAAKIGGSIASGVGTAATIGSMLQQPQQRDLSYEEFLEARGRLGGFKKAAKVGGAVASGVGTAATLGSVLESQQEERSFERREPLRISPSAISSGLSVAGKLGKAAAGGIALGAAVAPVFAPHQRRDLEELDARGFKISGATATKLGTAAASAAGFGGIIAALDAKHQRDLSEVEAREPGIGGLIKGVEGLVSHILRREESLNDLD
ncbi:hypothetical protein BJ165DRAFT_1449249 [Panaeolus papilionaceus]|nr:hypothetical protein BJ165DRAFT_1449249 [Panaeolus papilionaceus]